VFLEPLVERAEIGMAAVSAAAKDGTLHIDDELHLTPLAAEEEDPEVAKLRAALYRRIGEEQLPELILAVANPQTPSCSTGVVTLTYRGNQELCQAMLSQIDN
jgi:hypothetical protein